MVVGDHGLVGRRGLLLPGPEAMPLPLSLLDVGVGVYVNEHGYVETGGEPQGLQDGRRPFEVSVRDHRLVRVSRRVIAQPIVVLH